MRKVFSGVCIAVGLGLLFGALYNKLHGQQIPVMASMTFVDADAACPGWPAASNYALSQAPNPASSLQIFVNGIRWSPGVDYSVNGAAVTLLNGQSFSAGDSVVCGYRVTVYHQMAEKSKQETAQCYYRGDLVMRVIEECGLNFALGSVVKYVCRSGMKPGESTVDDLKKAQWYLARQIENYSKPSRFSVDPRAEALSEALDGNQ